MGIDTAFLFSVCENPEDDTVRLIYADWLEERGDPRGEFIRVQVELASMTADSPRRRELAFRAHEFLGKHGEEWAAPLCPHVEEWHFRRGFIDRIAISAKNLVELGAELFRLAPIERIRVTGRDGNNGFLAALPPWAAIRSLDLIANNLRADIIPAIASNPALRNLRRLVLCLNPIGDAAAAMLCEQPFYQSLEDLQCGGNCFSSESTALLRQRFGACLSFGYQREDDHLYTFGTAGRSYWRAGVGKELTQILLLPGHHHLETLTFDFEGNLIRSQLTQYRAKTWDEALDSRFAKLRLDPATIYGKRFKTAEGKELRDIETCGFKPFDSPSEWSEEDRRSQLKNLHEYWLPKGLFAYTAGNNPWIDKTGEIVAT
jgi:uncharacterized protein (TIGR02996 family)